MNNEYTPNCRKCDNQVVHADAGVLTSKPYLYCRTCKIEVDTWGYEVHAARTELDVSELEEYLRLHPEMQGYETSYIIDQMQKEHERRSELYPSINVDSSGRILLKVGSKITQPISFGGIGRLDRTSQVSGLTGNRTQIIRLGTGRFIH